MMIPRRTYFPMVLDKIQRYFSQFINGDKTHEMWLDDAGQAVKW